MLTGAAMRIALLAFVTLAASCAYKPRVVVDADKQYAQAYLNVGSVQVTVLGDELDDDDKAAVRSIYEVLAPNATPGRTVALRLALTVTGKPVSSVYCSITTGFECPRSFRVQIPAGYAFTVVHARQLGDKPFGFERHYNHIPKAVGTKGPWATSPPDVEKAQRYSRQAALEEMIGSFCNDAMLMFAVDLPYRALTSANLKTSKACLEWMPHEARQKRIARSMLGHQEWPSALHLRAAALLEPDDLDAAELAQMAQWFRDSDTQRRLVADKLFYPCGTFSQFYTDAYNRDNKRLATYVACIRDAIELRLHAIGDAPVELRRSMIQTAHKMLQQLKNVALRNKIDVNDIIGSAEDTMATLVHDPDAEARRFIVANGYVRDLDALYSMAAKDPDRDVRQAASRWASIIRSKQRN